MLSTQFTEEDKQALDYERFNYPDPRIQRKMEVLWLVSQGLSRSEVASLADVSTKTVRRYIKLYKRGGIEALKQSLYRGRKSELEPHVQSLKEYFAKHPPCTVKEAQAAIERLTGIRRGESQVCAFLKRLGLRRRKMATVPGKVDDAKQKEQREFLEEKLNPRLDEAEAGSRKLFFLSRHRSL